MDPVFIFPNPDTLAKAVAFRFCKEAQQAAVKNRLYSVALSGGATADKIYRQFGSSEFRDKIPWELVHLFWTDERCVSPESVESNFRTAQHAFLNSVDIPDKNIHRMKGEEDPFREADRYALEIQDHQVLRENTSSYFDWVLMGLGLDGHTASIFPGKEDLFTTPNLCSVSEHPQTSQNRITLTGSAFQKADCITYHVIGLDKAKIVSELASNSFESTKLPAAFIPGEWYLDQAAASSLKNT